MQNHLQRLVPDDRREHATTDLFDVASNHTPRFNSPNSVITFDQQSFINNNNVPTHTLSGQTSEILSEFMTENNPSERIERDAVLVIDSFVPSSSNKWNEVRFQNEFKKFLQIKADFKNKF